MGFVPDSTLKSLNAMTESQLDQLPYGVVKVDDTGVVQMYNRYEAELAGIDQHGTKGRNFFTEIAPCTNNRLFFGRFKDGVVKNDVNVAMPYTFTYKMRPTNVNIHIWRDQTSRANWVLVQKR